MNQVNGLYQALVNLQQSFQYLQQVESNIKQLQNNRRSTNHQGVKDLSTKNIPLFLFVLATCFSLGILIASTFFAPWLYLNILLTFAVFSVTTWFLHKKAYHFWMWFFLLNSVMQMWKIFRAYFGEMLFPLNFFGCFVLVASIVATPFLVKLVYVVLNSVAETTRDDAAAINSKNQQHNQNVNQQLTQWQRALPGAQQAVNQCLMGNWFPQQYLRTDALQFFVATISKQRFATMPQLVQLYEAYLQQQRALEARRKAEEERRRAAEEARQNSYSSQSTSDDDYYDSLLCQEDMRLHRQHTAHKEYKEAVEQAECDLKEEARQAAYRAQKAAEQEAYRAKHGN